MNKTQFAIVGSPSFISDLSEAAKSSPQHISVSAPVSTKSPADVLDAPMGAEEIRRILEMIAIILKTASAGMVLVNLIRETFSKHKGEEVLVKDLKSGVIVCKLNSSNAADEIEKLLKVDK